MMWEDLGGFILLALIYGVAALVRKGQQAANRKKRSPAPRPPVEQKPDMWQPGFPADHTATLKGTQAEGARLADLLLTMDQVLERKVKGPAPAPAPPEEPQVGVKNFDSGAEAVVLRRRAEAEARNAARTLADHAAFDKRIRTAEPTVVVSRGPSIQQLRQAFIWKEILDEPVGVRGEK